MTQTDLLRRLERLERSNRRLKWGATAALAAFGAVGLMSASTVCKTVWGERFVLRDGQGRDRVTWDAYSNKTPKLTFQGQRGQALATMAFDEEGAMQLQVRKNGELQPAYLQMMGEAPSKSECASGSSCQGEDPDVN